MFETAHVLQQIQELPQTKHDQAKQVPSVHSVSAPSTPFIQAKFLCGKYAAPADVMDALPSIVALLSKSRTKARTNVLFPQPLGPTIATFSPCRSKKLIFLSTTSAKGRLKNQPILTPNRFLRFWEMDNP